MDKIVRGIFLSQRGDKDKSVLIKTLKPHLLTIDASIAESIASFCVPELSNDKKLTRLLSATVLEILSQSHPFELLNELTKQQIDTAEYRATCCMIVADRLKRHSSMPSEQRDLVVYLLIQNEELASLFNAEQIKAVLPAVPRICSWFNHALQWMELVFTLLSTPVVEALVLENHVEFPLTASDLSDQVRTIHCLQCVSSRVANGSLTRLQGRLLSTITHPITINTACQEIISLLPDEGLEKCLANMVKIQIQGEWLSAWIGAFVIALMNKKGLLEVLQITERCANLLVDVEDEDSVKLLCRFLLVHQHSPFLFHRLFPKLLALKSSSNVPELSDTIESLILKFPHFNRLYSSYFLKGFTSSIPWAKLHQTLVESKLRSCHGVGCQNLGNSCYFNSLLQALHLTSPFQMDVILANHDSSVLSELQKTFLRLSFSLRPCLSPESLYHTVRPAWFSMGSQQDAAELLRHLFDKISSGRVDENTLTPEVSGLLGGAKKGPEKAGLLGGDFSLEPKLKQIRVPPKDVTLQSSPSQIVSKHFEGSLETRIICQTCQNISSKQETFLSLSLPFPETKQSNHTIEGMIMDSLAPERLEGNNKYLCDTCEGHQDGSRLTKLTKLPNCLILTLNRFSFSRESNSRSKILDQVKIPSDIYFTHCRADSSITVSPEQPGSTSTYKLYAAVIHSGSTPDSGHYFTYGAPSAFAPSLNILKHSLLFNDSIVESIDSDQINSPRTSIETPYLLFYQQVNDEITPIQRPMVDLDMSRLTDIIRDNIQYLKEEERVSSVSIKEIDGKQEKGGDDEGKDKLPGCTVNDFSSPSSSRFIF